MAETMLAAVFEDLGKLTLRDVSVPRITRRDQIKLEIEAVGICGTDVHIVAVPPGFIVKPPLVLGHEFVGRVIELGEDVTHLKLGNRVVCNPNDYCGVCTFCRMEHPNMCENMGAIGINIDGTFCKYFVLSAKIAFKISEHVPVNHGAFAEMLADVVNGTNKVRLQPGESALIIGAGPIGQLYAQVFRAAGAGKIIMADTSEWRLNFTRKMGFDLAVDPSQTDLKAFALAETGIGPDVVVDAAGSELALATDVVRPAGKVVAFGVNQTATASFPQFRVTSKELTIMGAWLANSTFPAAIKVLEAGVLNLDGLITHVMPLADIHKGLDLLARREALKIVVIP